MPHRGLVAQLRRPGGPPRRRRHVVATVAALSLLLNLVACQQGRQAGNALVDPRNLLGFGNTRTPLGQRYIFWLWLARARGERPIHLERAEMVKVDPGMVVDAIKAIGSKYDRADRLAHGPGAPGAFPYDDVPPVAKQALESVGSITLDPTCPPVQDCFTTGNPPDTTLGYLFVVIAHITKPGKYQAKGARFYYRIDGNEYQQVLNKAATIEI